MLGRCPCSGPISLAALDKPLACWDLSDEIRALREVATGVPYPGQLRFERHRGQKKSESVLQFGVTNEKLRAYL